MDEMRQLMGLRLKCNIYNANKNLLIPSNTILTEHHIDKLLKQGITITDEDMFIPEANDQQLVKAAVIDVEDFFKKVEHSGKICLSDLEDKIVPAIMEIAKNPQLLKLLVDLHDKDSYTFRHTIAVGVISTLIGKWLKLNTYEVNELAIAAALHDIGKAKIPNDIINKPGKLTYEEYRLMKRHTIIGYKLIKATYPENHVAALVALQHHEREDGTGYPNRLYGHDLHLYSKITAVADVFHAMSSKRVYKEAMPFYQVMKLMKEQMFGQLNPQICSLFFEHVMDALIGKEVVLSNGLCGRIVMVNPQDPANPLIKTNGSYLDLSKEPEIHVELVI